jgi:hypothetical protein
MENYIITKNVKNNYHFSNMKSKTNESTFSLTILSTKQIKKFMKRLEYNYENNLKDNHFIFQDNLYLKSFTNNNTQYLKIKNLYGNAKIEVNIVVCYELFDAFLSQ